MRFIDLERIRPEIRDEILRLEEAQRAVLAEADPVRRSALIDGFQPRWVALRPAFERASHHKCWYLECKNPGTDDDIDHFRPKKRVQEDATHPGYYWMALTWTNFRLSCHRANRARVNPDTGDTGGKADHFPLVDPSTRVMSHVGNLRHEGPALLDPTSPLDPPVLSFLPNGEVALAPQFKGIAVAEARFDASRIHLHLNWPEVRDGRLVLYNTIERAVNRGLREAPVDSANSLPPAEAFVDVVRDLVNAMKSEAEYSAAARVYVESFGHVWWIKDIVLRAAA